jgi:ABC-type transporter Mla subunit MlaD
MSEERPTSDAARDEARDEADEARTDPDAWATACAEDLAAENARRRAQHGPPPGSAAEELRKLADAVADRLSGLRSPLFGAVASGTAQQMVNQVVQQAKTIVEPVIERNPQVFDHLAAAGSELLAAYRSAVEAQERRWTSRDTDRRDRGDEGQDPGPGERIDLD